MPKDALTLSEREKETLRLLVGGHDAKSIARHLGLSVHTINERLRDARQKLDVSSSREAARLLAQAEQATPNSLADKQLGVAQASDGRAYEAGRRQNANYRLAWFGGGMVIMSLFIAALALSSVFHGSVAPAAQGTDSPAIIADATPAASLGSAQDWLALVDRQSWDDSWQTAASLFKSQITAAQWSAMIQSVRLPLGPVSSRTFQHVTKANALPGAPEGEYEVIQFQTNFAHKAGAVETVTLAHDQFGWKVAGYFIR